MSGEEGSEVEVPAASAIAEGEGSILEVSPFDVHFSQEHIRNTFQDGRLLDDSVKEIEVVPHPPPAAASASDEAPKDSGAKFAEDEDVLFMKVPFPRIEVIRWRCKLREADGAPKLDPVTGLQLFGEEETWFSFDNRRLCCLQRAAASVWPKRAVCEVVEVAMSQVRARELRKFDTRTFGNSVAVNKKDDPVTGLPSPSETWCWRTAVGLPPESQPEAGVARQASGSLRRRAQRPQGPNSGRNKGRRQSRDEADSSVERTSGSEFARSLSLFLLVYLALRFAMWAIRTEHWSTLRERVLALLSGGPSNTAP